MLSKNILTVLGILLPFFGTALGASAVLLVPGKSSKTTEKILFGFASGVMLASLVWSLLIPSLSQSQTPLPTLAGFLSGIIFFLCSDVLFERISKKRSVSGTAKMIFAVTLHNLPEGMAVGVAFAGALTDPSIGIHSAMLLSVGIALQNLPEGSIVSSPLTVCGQSKGKAFGVGVLSGAIEPIGAVSALLLTRLIEGLLPFLLSFAAGAMLYVAADELIPSISHGKGKKVGLFALGIGFSLMMAMDVIFG